MARAKRKRSVKKIKIGTTGAHEAPIRAPVPAPIAGLMRGPTIHEIPARALLGFGTERMCFLSLD